MEAIALNRQARVVARSGECPGTWYTFGGVTHTEAALSLVRRIYEDHPIGVPLRVEVQTRETPRRKNLVPTFDHVVTFCEMRGWRVTPRRGDG